jgi:acetate kinase
MTRPGQTRRRQASHEPAGAKPSGPCILTINGGSSSIKFALFDAGGQARRVLAGRIEGVGLPEGSFTVKGPGENFSRKVAAPDHHAAVGLLMDWVQGRVESRELVAVGHRVVHGGPRYWEPQRITPEMMAELRQLSVFDPEHLPEEILLTEAFHRRYPDLVQIACFDTAFHHDMPRVARLLPIPRRYDAKGVQRFGFHGLSCAYLMGELARVAGARAAKGRVVLAHLGNGASVTAVHAGRSVDTSMGLTPTSGLPMSSRSGDMDPALAWYLAQTEHVTAKQFYHMVNHESGLLGVSETSPDRRELLLREKEDIRAAEAVALFCYCAKKCVCAMAGALGGLDTLVFAGGIGENAPQVRARICEGLGFIGVELDGAANGAGAPVISSAAGSVSVRVIRTDEERMIAEIVRRMLA